MPTPLRIAFIHPNLGIGGAERLVVDAAVGLQDLGHHVEIFTSFHQDGPSGRSFEETKDGTLKVHVLGDSIFPQSLFGRFTIICAILRQFHLAVSLLWATLLYHCNPRLPVLIPLARPFTSSADWSLRRQLKPFDVIVVDQLSACVPVLRWFGHNRIVFYCHFPDLLLSPSRSAHEHLAAQKRGKSPKELLRSIYRYPIDKLEEITTGQADKIVVNSQFTREVFGRTFKAMQRLPAVVYPGIDVGAFGEGEAKDVDETIAWLVPTSDEPIFLSINRFESKKDIDLAINALAMARKTNPKFRLIAAGGYDSDLNDNVTTLLRLQKLATSLNLTTYIYSATPVTPTSSPDLPNITSTKPLITTDIVFLLNMANAHKSILLASPNVVALLYTPSYEHFGIVPLEAMASRLPVVATTSGGPVETILDDGLDDPSTTGLLRSPEAEVWSQALLDLVALPTERRQAIGQAGRQRVKDNFSVSKLAKELEKVCKVAAAITDPIFEETGFLMFMASTMIIEIMVVSITLLTVLW